MSLFCKNSPYCIIAQNMYIIIGNIMYKHSLVAYALFWRCFFVLLADQPLLVYLNLDKLLNQEQNIEIRDYIIISVPSSKIVFDHFSIFSKHLIIMNMKLILQESFIYVFFLPIPINILIFLTFLKTTGVIFVYLKYSLIWLF